MSPDAPWRISTSLSSEPTGAPPVQYWYFRRAGGLTTPAIWPEPVSTKRTGPPKNEEPMKTDFAGAM